MSLSKTITKGKKLASSGKEPVGACKMQIVMVEEGTDPETYLVSVGKDAPRCLHKAIRAGNTVFKHINFDEGAAGTAEIVDEEDEDADEKVEELHNWIEEKCVADNEFKPPGGVDIYLSIVQM
jgi:hypothetical protein